MFNNLQQQPQQGMFGQSSGLFGSNNTVNQASQQGGNFLSGFNPTASQTMAQPTAGTAMFKPRKWLEFILNLLIVLNRIKIF